MGDDRREYCQSQNQRTATRRQGHNRTRKLCAFRRRSSVDSERHPPAPAEDHLAFDNQILRASPFSVSPYWNLPDRRVRDSRPCLKYRRRAISTALSDSSIFMPERRLRTLWLSNSAEASKRLRTRIFSSL